MAARRPHDDGRPRASLEGRLDLDVIGDDGPRTGERLAGWWRGVVAEHRTTVVAVAVVAALLLVSGAVWWARRPVPLAPPQVSARAAGQEPTASLVVDATSGRYDGVQQRLLLVSGEAPGVAVRLLGIAGPGLVVADRGPGLDLGDGGAQRPLVVGAGLACTTPEETTAALSSSASDYGLVLQRTSPSGEVRVDQVPVLGSATLADLVHKACLQVALDRDLRVDRLTAEAVPGTVAVRLEVGLVNTSPRVWTGLHVAAAAQPVVVNDGLQVQLEPGTSGDLHALLWPEDCADPAAALRDGVAVEADLGPTGRPPAQGSSTSSAQLRLPAALVDDVARVAVAACGTTPPRGTVGWARLREGGGNGSGGVIDLGLTITAPGAGLVEVDHLGDGSASAGELFAYESPVHVIDGVASIKAQWRLPGCPALLRDGLPRLHVVLAGDVRRPYLLRLSGDALRPVLFRLCGNEVADLLG